MPRIMSHSAAAAALAVAVAIALPAQAQNGTLARSFVSAAGSDSNNCANVATPCRHFATAFAATAPGGEIFVLDPANYGSLTITYAVNIEGHGWASIAPPNGGNGITINAGASDAVNLSGLVIEGGGGGLNGIVFNSGGILTVNNCVVQNLQTTSGPQATGNGILMQPTSSASLRFVITNTIVNNNGFAGILYSPPSGSATATGVIDHVVAANNSRFGISFNTQSGGGSTTATISNSIASNSNNGNVGILAQSGSATLAVSIDNTVVSGNETGIIASGTPEVTLGRSVITANSGFAIVNATSPNTFFSYNDNRISGNGGNISGSLNPLTPQ